MKAVGGRDGILVEGSVNLDMVVRSPHIPAPGENICGAGFSMVAGGKGANQAVAAKRLGKDAYMFGCVGRDIFGDFLLDRLEASGVETSFVVRREDASTGVALIVVEEGTGINTIVVDPGANMRITPGDLDMLEGRYSDVTAVLFQLEIPLEVVLEGSRRARERGLLTVLDAGPPRGAGTAVLEHFDVVSPNSAELADLTGTSVDSVADAADAASGLVEAGVPTVVVKMGEMGAVLVDGEGARHLHPFAVKAVDATAAGDAFTAGLAVGLTEGMEVEQAVRFANAAGAAAVTVFGAQPSMPARERVEELLRSQEAGCSAL